MGRPRGCAPRALALAISVALAGHAQANPTGPSVVSGQATFATGARSLTVTNTPGAIIQWQGFSIARDEFTRFVQQSSLSAVLNRVVGGNPSEILGRLASNGRVFLINPNGITFGAGATIDVAGLVASTLHLWDSDFIAGRLRFSGSGSEAPIVNRGEIVTPAGGNVFLVAPQIENSGLIRAPSGDIVLAAGSSVRLLDASFPSIQVEVSAPNDRSLSLGDLSGGGRVFAFLVKNSGVVSASTAVGEGGRIALKSAGNVEVAAGARIEASGPVGGSIALHATQVAMIAGALEARSTAGGGGTIRVEAPRVVVEQTAVADASGVSRGGVIELRATELAGIAGALEARATAGEGGTIRVEAPRVVVEPTAVVDASGVSRGGEIELRATELAGIAGALEARATAGEGGTIRVEAPRVVVEPTAVVDASGVSRGGEIELRATELASIAGALEARGSVGEGGTISVEAPRVVVEPTAVVDASGRTRGGEIELRATELAGIAGALEARGSVGEGGTISVEAPRIVVEPTAVVAASGAARGGEIELRATELAGIAGALEARASAGEGGTIVAEAPRVVVERTAAIDVSGSAGGGEVSIIGDLARFAGAIEARAELSGDGGRVEVSGRRSLEFAGSVDTRGGAGGSDGDLLIDPARITVVAGSTGLPAALGDAAWTISEDLGSQTLGALDLATLLATTSVTLQASEKITIAAGAEVVSAPAAPRTLTLQAPEIEVQGSIRSSRAPVSVVLDAGAGRLNVAGQAELQLGGGALRVAAQAVNVAPAQRPEPQVAVERAAQPMSEIARMRKEIEAEVARDRERLAAAMQNACRAPGTVREGCSVQAAPRRYSFGV